MIAYICNCCKKPIDLDEKHCVHLEIRFGRMSIIEKGKYGDGYSVDLCQSCYEKLRPLIDDYYYGGNTYLIEKEN